MTEAKPGIIRAKDISKTYGAGTSAVSALRGVSFSIEPGECIGILGKSGSGKSTLMNLLGGLDQPTAGELNVAGHALHTLSRKQLADFRLQRIGFIFQSFHLIPNQTVLENVELPLMLAGVPRKSRRRRALQILDSVGLSSRLGHRPPQLSGGERQRTAVARALVHQPAVVLADEPTGNLDSMNSSAVVALMLDQVRQHGTTLLLVTHDRELATRITSRIIALQDGAVVD